MIIEIGKSKKHKFKFWKKIENDITLIEISIFKIIIAISPKLNFRYRSSQK